MPPLSAKTVPRRNRWLHPAVMPAFLLFALSTFNSEATAAWTRVGGNNDISGAYADPASIQKAGEMVRMKSLLDFRSARTDHSRGDDPYLTEIDLREYDCKNRRYHLLRFSLRSGHMGDGKIVKSGPPIKDWWPVLPGSIGDALLQFACGKD